MIGIVLLIIIFILNKLIIRLLSSYLISFRYNKYCVFIVSLILHSGIFTSLLSLVLPSNIIFCHYLIRYSYIWLGFILYLYLSLVILYVVRLIVKLILKDKYNLKLAQNVSFIFACVFTIFMNIYGLYNAHDIKVTNYDISINKESKLTDLNIIFISDLHLGLNDGLLEVDNLVNDINSLNPDVVLLGGDIFDNNFDLIENPIDISKRLSNIKSKYGVYTCLGNHDVQEVSFFGFTFSYLSSNKNNVCADDRMLKFIEDCNIKLLYDDYVEIEDIIIYGRPDYKKINLHNSSRLSSLEIFNKINNSNDCLIIIDHQPREQVDLSNIGCDLLLNGHTHKGQIWPFTSILNIVWDNGYGYKKYNNMHNIVSSGVGIYGFNMRIGSFGEICNIKLHFN